MKRLPALPLVLALLIAGQAAAERVGECRPSPPVLERLVKVG
jgi:hypothetical protein